MKEFTTFLLAISTLLCIAQNQNSVVNLNEREQQVVNDATEITNNLLAYFEAREEYRQSIRDQISRANEKLVHAKIPINKKLTALTFTPDSRYLVGASNEKSVTVWDLSNNSVFRTYEMNEIPYDVTFGPQGRFLAISTRKEVQIWDFAKDELYDRIVLETKQATWSDPVEFIKDQPGTLIYLESKFKATGASSNTFVKYNFVKKEIISRSNATEKRKGMLGVGLMISWRPTPDGKNIVIQNTNGVYLFNLANSEKVLDYQIKVKGQKGVGSFKGGHPAGFTSDGSSVFIINREDLVQYSVLNGRELFRQPISVADNFQSDKMKFSPNTRFFLIAGESTVSSGEPVVSLDVYKTDNLQRMISFPSDILDNRESYFYDWSRNGQYIAKFCGTCSGNTIVIYDIKTKDEPSTQPPSSSSNSSKYDDLRELKKLLDEGIITQAEFDSEKKKILGN